MVLRSRPLTSRKIVRRGVVVAAAVVTAIVLFGQRIGERQRSPESSAISTLRAITSGESTYVAMYGYYDTPQCLASRRPCAPDVATQDPLLERDFTEHQESSNYQFQFFAGPAFRLGQNGSRSASAMTQYAVIAVPVTIRGQHRSFCTDDRQTIYISATENTPVVENGRCRDDTSPLH